MYFDMSCTWMIIIDSLFYASGSLSLDVSWEYIPKLLVACLYPHRHYHTKTIKIFTRNRLNYPALYIMHTQTPMVHKKKNFDIDLCLYIWLCF